MERFIILAPVGGIGSNQRGPAAAQYRTQEQQAAFFDELKGWIERENPTPEQIAKRMDEYGEPPKRQ